MVGFVAGLPFMYQMVDRPRQIQVPKYLRPRTDTPKLTVGYGGCFSCIYSVRGAGGYQMFGITPMPIFDPEQKTSYLRDFMVFFRPGDIVKFKPIGREEYDHAVEGRRGRALRAGDPRGQVRPARVPEGHRRLQLQAGGHDPMTVRVLNPGLSTTVQDLGRPGYFHLGIPIGGAMDRLALRAGNLLVGNDEGAAGLEAVFVGPQLEFTSDALIAVTGAEMPIKLDGEEQPSWTALKVKAGQVLSFGFLKTGARIYIAIAGGIDVPVALGSRSTYPIGALGGFKGRAIAKDDELPVGAAAGAKGGSPASGRAAPQAGQAGRTARPAGALLAPGRRGSRSRTSSTTSWKVAPEADRMGYRFRGGRPLKFVEREQPFGAGSDPSNIVDSCYPYGSIQVPGGTEPIILHRDAVSGGGYFMVGTVISADMDLIGQLQPNTPTRFVKVDMAGALQARADRSALLARIRETLQ